MLGLVDAAHAAAADLIQHQVAAQRQALLAVLQMLHLVLRDLLLAQQLRGQGLRIGVIGDGNTLLGDRIQEVSHFVLGEDARLRSRIARIAEPSCP